MARLTILSKGEIQEVYSIPTLDDEERTSLFSLDENDIEYLNTIKNNTPRKINYILQLGYYRAVEYLFKFSFQKVKTDVEFINHQYFPEEPFPKNISANFHYINRCQIMKKYCLKEPDTRFYKELSNTAKSFATRHVLPNLYYKNCYLIVNSKIF